MNHSLNHKSKSVYVAFLVLILLTFSVHAAQYKPINLHPEYEHDKWVTKIQNKEIDPSVVKEFRAYTSVFDSEDDNNNDGISDLWRIPLFVTYEMRAIDDLAKSPKRPSPWMTDKDLFEKGIAPKDESYKYSSAFRKNNPDWYDRGHLCAKHHAWRLGSFADWNTHTIINAVPQRHSFNNGIWKNMEYLNAKWADKYGKIWIITGSMFNNKTPTKWIGETQKGERLVAIPDFLFRIIIREENNQLKVLAFKYPQQDSKEGFKKKPFNHERYLVSIDSIEEETGLDFLTALPNDVEACIESKIADKLWE